MRKFGMTLLATLSGLIAWPGMSSALEPEQVVQTICIACHNEHTLQAGLNLQGFDPHNPSLQPAIAEKMVRKLNAGQMPPREFPRDQADIDQLVATLEGGLDRAAKRNGKVGSRPFQRLNRAEYARLVYDLLGLSIDPGNWLPQDQISASFDNISDVQGMSPTLLTAYLNAASDIARQAIGQADAPTVATTYSNSPLVSQHEWERIEGAPYGTRGGMSVLHNFPADGEYSFSMRFRLGYGERFQDIDISIDGVRVALVKYGGDIDYQGHKEFPVATPPVFIGAGEHRLSAAFIRRQDGPYEDLLRPNERSLAGIATGYGTTSLPHLMHLNVEGPRNATGVSETAARQRIFSCRPTAAADAPACAEKIIHQLADRAYGTPVDTGELDSLMQFYRLGAAGGNFEHGIRTALEAILSSPRFLFRMEVEPSSARPGNAYRIADLDLAKRLSFFLWGSNPDAELLALAESGKLSRTRTLRSQTERMLNDSRAIALSTRFASLWLRLQDLDQLEPDEYLFPNYNQQLVDAMRNETQYFFDYLVRENRSLLDLYGADYTFLNERLAKHYGIPGVIGDEFRRVPYQDDTRRGVFGHGSILAQTSLGNRTSPVLRGKWVAEVLIGTPPPPPPPGVPDLEETEAAANGEMLTTRQRMEAHRSNPVCAACHKVMDPIGLALDNFDVTGKWRTREFGMPLDTASIFYDGTAIETPADLSRVLLKRPVPLVREFTANLMAYAIGRRVDYYDQPTVRAIVDEAAEDDYRVRSLIIGVVMSDRFRMKEAPERDEQIVANIEAEAQSSIDSEQATR